ncbi:hypothetical protein AAFF_G00078210 [Aldrovandia affinis]|uniref:Uncharacterized protein n=1 Tax=Aldrovandia affinis TaxID=143900 RepID=A0AAD7RY06_9TELE|nr:hypothetical protein AAFF_G00078210 [Aldrovandia affinis]
MCLKFLQVLLVQQRSQNWEVMRGKHLVRDTGQTGNTNLQAFYNNRHHRPSCMTNSPSQQSVSGDNVSKSTPARDDASRAGCHGKRARGSPLIKSDGQWRSLSVKRGRDPDDQNPMLLSTLDAILDGATESGNRCLLTDPQLFTSSPAALPFQITSLQHLLS